MTVSTRARGRRWANIYALLTGILGLFILGQLFARQAMSVDLPPLLLFTGVALIVSYFHVPIGERDAELSLDGAILLGATLVGGSALGGWAAFITGLATPMKRVKGIRPTSITHSAEHPARRSFMSKPTGWVDRAAIAALNGGRNVIAIAAAWMAYRGMGGTLAPTAINTRLALALIMLCVVYALVRCLWQWPAILLKSTAPRQVLTGIAHPVTILIELVPLPVSLLISATFVQLGWSFYLLLALVFIGLGAVMRQMIETIYALRVQMDTLALRDRIRQAIANTPRELAPLISLAHQLCGEVIEVAKFEVGLYPRKGKPDQTTSGPRGEVFDRSSLTHVNIQVAAHNGQNLPPMRIPITPLWTWLSELAEPLLVQTEVQLEQLPFTLPPLSGGKGPQATMFVPLVPLASTLSQQDSNEDSQEPAPKPIGAFVFQSPHPNAFSASDLAQVTLIADLIAAAMGTLGERAHPP